MGRPEAGVEAVQNYGIVGEGPEARRPFDVAHRTGHDYWIGTPKALGDRDISVGAVKYFEITSQACVLYTLELANVEVPVWVFRIPTARPLQKPEARLGNIVHFAFALSGRGRGDILSILAPADAKVEEQVVISNSQPAMNHPGDNEPGLILPLFPTVVVKENVRLDRRPRPVTDNHDGPLRELLGGEGNRHDCSRAGWQQGDRGHGEYHGPDES